MKASKQSPPQQPFPPEQLQIRPSKSIPSPFDKNLPTILKISNFSNSPLSSQPQNALEKDNKVGNKADFPASLEDLDHLPTHFTSSSYHTHEKLLQDHNVNSTEPLDDTQGAENCANLHHSQRQFGCQGSSNEMQGHIQLTILSNDQPDTISLTPAPIDAESRQGQETAETDLNHQEGVMTSDQAKYLLNEILESYLFIGIIYVLGVLTAKKWIPYNVLLGYLVFISVFQLFRTICSSRQSQLFSRTKKFFSILDWGSLSVLAIASLMRLQYNHLPLSPFVAPGIITTFIFWIFANPNMYCIKKIGLVAIKLIFWLQLLMITFKIDNVLETWISVFVVLYYILVFVMSFSIGLFILTIAYVWQNFSSSPCDATGVGLFWDFLNTLFSWIWSFIVLSLIDLFEEGNSTILFTCLFVGIGHIAFLGLFTILTKKSLIEYLQTALLIEDEDYSEDGIIQHEHNFKFEVVKENMPYLVRVSPTYFILSNQNSHAATAPKKSNNNRNRRPKISLSLRLKKRRQQLKKAQQEDGDPKDNNNMTVLSVTQIPNNRVFLGQSIINPNESILKEKDGQKNDESLDSGRMCYSRDDAEIMKDLESLQENKAPSDEMVEVDEKQCMICLDQIPNAVFMNCGHGGICYECALEVWKKDDSCLLCRQPIAEILKIVLVPGVNVAKVVEGTKRSIVLE